MKFLIAGLGSIGRRHLKNLLALGQKDIVLYRTHQSTLGDEDLQEFPVEQDIQKALSHKPDAVIISNPTALAYGSCSPCCGCPDVLYSLKNPWQAHRMTCSSWKASLQEKGNIVFSAFQFRFNPGLRKIDQASERWNYGKPISFDCYWGEYLPDWHPWEDYRKSYSANQALGGRGGEDFVPSV